MKLSSWALAFGIVAGDAHDVALVLLHEVGVLVDQGLAHARGVVDVHAEDDGLLEAVAAFLQELGDLCGDALGALVDDQIAVEVLLVVDAVFDLLAVFVGLSLGRAVAFHVHVEMDFDHLVGSEEAVADALLQRVGVDRLAEVVDVGDVLGFLRRGGEADLGGAGEVFEDLAPGGIFGRAAAMALVDDDEVEEVRRELAEELLAFFRAGDGLVEAEIDLVGGVDAPCFLSTAVAGRPTLPSSRSMVLEPVLSLAIAAPKGRKSLTMVWSTSTLRSARNRMRFFRPAFHRRQMI